MLHIFNFPSLKSLEILGIQFFQQYCWRDYPLWFELPLYFCQKLVDLKLIDKFSKLQDKKLIYKNQLHFYTIKLNNKKNESNLIYSSIKNNKILRINFMTRWKSCWRLQITAERNWHKQMERHTMLTMLNNVKM